MSAIFSKNDPMKIIKPVRITNLGILIGIIIGVIVLLSIPLYATTTVFTAKGTGPLVHQTTYAGSGFTESKMQPTIDWMVANMKNYGYNYICLDGWVGDATTHNSDGYITKYKNDWTNTFQYWASQIHAKGLKFGIYYNPTWVHTTIADDTSHLIKGTTYTIKSITNPDHMHQTRYIIDPGKPGAEQYVKGMIDYYKSIGIDLLKVDFIRYIDDEYGQTATANVYRWMREAAGDSMIIYYANQKNRSHAADEKQYADLIRVTEDYHDFWGHASSWNRGTTQDGAWAPAYNVFDGFVWFSDISGKNKVILDGDQLKLHNSTSADEKRFMISIYIMAGAGIDVGDSYSDMVSGDYTYYRNTEVIQLNSEGLVGVPLTRTLSDSRSQIWKGQTNNGDWIVGLFNREDTAQTRSISFSSDLGISGSKPVRDLWAKSDLGSRSSYSASIPAHGVKLLRISMSSSSPGTTVNPSADTYTRDGSYANTNYGTSTTLMVKKASTNNRKTYLIFNFSAFTPTTVTSAKLRVYVSAANTDASRTIKLYGLSNETWSETAVTWNAPPSGTTTSIGSKTMSNTTGVWYEYDVKSYVSSHLSDKRVSFLLVNEGTATDKSDITFSSRQATANKPQLVLQ